MKRRRQRTPNPPKSASPSQGLWRDRNFLVIDLQKHQFPPRCLKSNLPCELPTAFVTLRTTQVAPLEVDRLEDDEELMESGRVQITRHSGETVALRLQLPLRPGWRRLITLPWGTRLAMAGGAGIFFSVLMIYLQARFRPFWLDWLSGGEMLFGSMVLLLSGLVIRICLSWLLPIRRIEEKLVWLGGVHSDWLRSLPEFVPSSQMLIRELEVANWKFWPTLATGFVFVIFTFVTIASVTPDYLGRWVIGFYLIGIAIAILMANATSGHILRTRQRLDELYLSRLRRRGRKRP